MTYSEIKVLIPPRAESSSNIHMKRGTELKAGALKKGVVGFVSENGPWKNGFSPHEAQVSQ